MCTATVVEQFGLWRQIRGTAADCRSASPPVRSMFSTRAPMMERGGGDGKGSPVRGRWRRFRVRWRALGLVPPQVWPAALTWPNPTLPVADLIILTACRLTASQPGVDQGSDYLVSMSDARFAADVRDTAGYLTVLVGLMELVELGLVEMVDDVDAKPRPRETWPDDLVDVAQFDLMGPRRFAEYITNLAAVARGQVDSHARRQLHAAARPDIDTIVTVLARHATPSVARDGRHQRPARP
jgi:hypothetical protein